MSAMFEKAVCFAMESHRGMQRKSENIPYVLHPMEVATIAATLTDKEDVLVAALLHDTVEDTGVTLDQIEQEFGSRVRELVASETENKRRDLPSQNTWLIRKKESLEFLNNTSDLDIKILWLADKLANMRSFYRLFSKEGSSMWNRFNQKDIKLQKWYYEGIMESLKDLDSSVAWNEYKELFLLVFKGV